MPEIVAQGAELTIGDTRHDLRHDVADVIEHDEAIVVLLSPDVGEYDDRNVLGFDREGTKRWESEIPEKSSHHTFLGITKQDNTIVGRSWNNHRYRIDPETGELENLGYSGK